MSNQRKSALALALTVFFLTQGFQIAGWFTSVDNALLAGCFRTRGARRASDGVVIVDIDPPVMAGLAAAGSPTGLLLYTQLIDRLHRMGARSIGLDSINTLASLSSVVVPADQMARLSAAVRGAGNVVLPSAIEPNTSERTNAADHSALSLFSLSSCEELSASGLHGTELAAPPTALIACAAGVGHITLVPDRDGVVRSVPLAGTAEGRHWPGFAAELVRVAGGIAPGAMVLTGDVADIGDRRTVVGEDGKVVVSFAGPTGCFAHLQARRVLAPDYVTMADAVRGKIVIVGLSAPGLASSWDTPVDHFMPRVEIHANAVSNLLLGSELHQVAPWVGSALALGLAILLAIWVQARGALSTTLLSLVLSLGMVTVMVPAFMAGHWFPMANPLLTVLVAGTVLVVYAATLSDRGRAQAEARLETRLQSITSIGSLVGHSRDREQLLGELILWVERELDCSASSVLLLDERRRKLHFAAASGEKADEVRAFSLELGQGVAGLVAQTGEPVLTNDADHDPRQAHDIADAIGFPTRSILCVPMLLHGEVMGVIEALNKRSGPFTLDDQTLLNVIAQQAALFLESARGYAQLQRRVEASTAELRAANRELAIEKTKLEALVDEMESGVVATDSAGKVVTWNRAAERFLGVSEEEAFGRPISSALKDQRLLSALSAPEALEPGGLTEEVEVGSDGQRYVLRAFVTAVAESEGEVGTLALLTDITQLKELDRMKTDLISFVSHELKNPLASIKGFAQLLRRGTDQASPNAHLVAMVNQQANRMQWIVEDFLDMTRLDAGIALQLDYRQIEDVGGLVRGICDLQALTAQEHTFSVEASPEPLSMTADRGKLEQVLVNLISNAVKYSPDGGAIAVTITGGARETVFRVADQGFGITSDQKVNLFRRFQRVPGARERIKGTGIGLFLSRYLVEAHGGQIWVQDNEPRGSVFGFTIPDRSLDREEPTGAEAASSLKLGDVLVLKKGHACGANQWEVVRLGADIKLKCQGCGRLVMLPRDRVERRIKAFLNQPLKPSE